MKRKTKKRIKNFLPIYIGVITFSISVASFSGIQPSDITKIVKSLLPQVPIPVCFRLTVFLLVVLGILGFVSVVLSRIYLRFLTPKTDYFEKINFGKPDENTVQEAVEGILDSRKTEPFYVHVVPKFNEVLTICSTLKQSGFAMIVGKPGEGKSMAAYQAAYSLEEQERYSIYSLRITDIEEKKWDEIRDQIFLELDESLKGKRKLILVDDAHNLGSKKYLKRELQKEAKENNGKYIWIETEEEYEESQLNANIRISFQNFKDRLVEDFYKTKDPKIQKALVGRIKGLEGAVAGAEEGQIADVWHFNFWVTRGGERLVRKVRNFKREELVELLVLFFISAHTIISRSESGLAEKYVIDTIKELGFEWLSEQKLSISAALRKLWVEEKLIRIYEKSGHDRYIRALHRNFAREIIRASILRESYVEDLLTSASTLLTDKYHLCTGYGVFRQDIGQYAPQFDRSNKCWIAKFISSPSIECLVIYPILLRSVREADSGLYTEIINDLNIGRLATNVSTVEVEQFHQLADLLAAIGNRRDELIGKGDGHDCLDLAQLSKKANSAKVWQFDPLAHLLRELGKCRSELIKEVNFKKLADAANSAEINQFEQIAELLEELGESKVQLSRLLDHNTLIEKANQAGPNHIRGLSMLVAELEEEDRSKYIREVDWSSLCLKCPIDGRLLSTLGASLENLWKQNEISPNRANIEKVTQYLRAHYVEIKEEIGRVNPKLYSGTAKFLFNCNRIDPALAKRIATETMSELVNRFRIGPTVYRGSGQLINALYAINHNLAVSFVRNNRVQGRIQQSINEHNWSEKVEGLKHLIKALYRSTPELWKKMVDYHWLTVNLSSLDLDSVYRDVDEERNAGTANSTA